ncbi:MAG TPA: sulfate ABC transporter substrate-binding protein [Candidatus Thermoplasmatota archaeon]|nr:sulfate ABC transporter substrate-binding protein [Candidatus Thermoplasmatota archaeon]
MPDDLDRQRRAGRAALAAFVACLVVYASLPWLPGVGSAPARTVVVDGYSILGDVMNQGLFPAFQDLWARRTGERVEFVSSFAGSGTVTNQIILGVPAEVAILSLELDAQRLAKAGRVEGAAWQRLPHHGVVTLTPFVILTRPGNPQGIHDFADLARPGVGVVHPDPLTSGGAQWSILAEYGSAVRETNRTEAGFEMLLGVWKNVVAQASSARAARTQFEAGFGDALVTYEQEAVYDAARGKLEAEAVVPKRTIMSENLVVVLDRNIPAEDRPVVDAFVQFLWSTEGQRVFVQFGFRSANATLTRENPALGPIEDAFTVADLGGWTVAKRDIIEGTWKARVLPEVGT